MFDKEESDSSDIKESLDSFFDNLLNESNENIKRYENELQEIQKKIDESKNVKECDINQTFISDNQNNNINSNYINENNSFGIYQNKFGADVNNKSNFNVGYTDNLEFSQNNKVNKFYNVKLNNGVDNKFINNSEEFNEDKIERQIINNKRNQDRSQKFQKILQNEMDKQMKNKNNDLSYEDEIDRIEASQELVGQNSKSEKALEIKKEHLDEIENEIKSQKKIPKKRKKKMVKKVLGNFLVCLISLSILFGLTYIYVNMNTEIFRRTLKLTSAISMIVTVFLFEISYRKSNSTLGRTWY